MASLEFAWWSYFRTFGISIVAGRGFTPSDGPEAERVAIVGENTAARYWPGESARGKQVRMNQDAPWLTVVGVAADTRYRELTRDWLTVYFPAPDRRCFAERS